MKKVNALLLASALIGAVTFTACEKDTNTDAGGVATITRKAPTSNVVALSTGDSLSVEYVLSSEKELKTLSVTKNGTALDLNGSATGNDYALNGKTFTYKASFGITSASGSIETYIFTLTDAKSNTVSDTINVGVIAAPVTLTESTNGEVFNVKGNGKGAFDLKAGAAVSASGDETTKDLKDQSTVPASGPVVFSKTWTSGTGNGSMFVKAGSSFDYANATNNSAAAAYAAGSASASTAVLAVGDIYIVKNTRFTNGYVVVKVTAVNETSADNEDNIKFSYKK